MARYGGDEFMMLDYGTELLEPVRVMERLHFLIAKKCEEKKIREQVLYPWGIPWALRWMVELGKRYCRNS